MEQNGNRGLVVGVIVVIIIVLAMLYFGGMFDGIGGTEDEKTQGETTRVEPEFIPFKELDGEFSASEPSQVFYEHNEETPALVGFEITAKDGKFSPDKIAIDLGIPAQITLRAVDADYDLFIPLPFGAHISVKEGDSKVFGISGGGTIESGRYMASCLDLCPFGKKSYLEFVIKK